ncbi:MAG TPA: (deoxy)nucleoside triphosphate pyrophosphohydrolase [Acidobacteriota bacterium]|nr:(deoxy)nucleoside triphosphate pyrophosphohydrolase [Acidobacteriota bacterium]
MSQTPGLIEVVAAIICRAERVLLCQRHDGPHLPLMWEFPGGKVDPGESPHYALRRELAEELDVDSEIGIQVADVEHHYSEKSVRIRFFLATITGEPAAIVHRAVRWVRVDTIPDYKVPPANEAVIRMIDKIATR